MTRRILVTGSRDWVDQELLERMLHKEYLWQCLELGAEPLPGTVVLVHGACPTGADKMADDLWVKNVGPDSIERHPADWHKHGKPAGFIRNAEMVGLGADVCLAFIRHHSKGATMTYDLAAKAGIECRAYYDHG